MMARSPGLRRAPKCEQVGARKLRASGEAGFRVCTHAIPLKPCRLDLQQSSPYGTREAATPSKRSIQLRHTNSAEGCRSTGRKLRYRVYGRTSDARMQSRASLSAPDTVLRATLFQTARTVPSPQRRHILKDHLRCPRAEVLTRSSICPELLSSVGSQSRLPLILLHLACSEARTRLVNGSLTSFAAPRTAPHASSSHAGAYPVASSQT